MPSIDKILKAVLFVLLCVFIFSSFYLPIEMEDIWWHLATGQWMMEHGQVPQVDMFSPTSPPIEYVLTQSPGSMLYYLVYRSGGLAAVKIFRPVLFLVITGIFFFYAYRRLPWPALVFLTYVTVFGLMTRALLRPFVFGFIFIEIYLIVLLRHQRGLDSKAIFWIPLLSMFWFNLHLESFVYGSLLIGIFWLSYGLEYLDARLKKDLTHDALTALQKFKSLTLVLTGHLASALVNPYGFKGAVYPLRAFFDDSFVVRKWLMPSIQELLPPVNLLDFTTAAWFYVLVCLVLLSLAVNQNYKFTRLSLFAVALLFFISFSRSSVFFILISLYLIAEVAADLKLKEKWQDWKYARFMERGVGLLFVVLILGQTVRISNSKVILDDNKTVRRMFLLKDPLIPQETFELLKQSAVTGVVYNGMGYGGYMVWAHYPALRPLTDGRQANPENFKNYLLIKRDPETNWPLAEKAYDFSVAVLDNGTSAHYKIIDFILRQPDWALVNVEGFTVTFVKRGVLSASGELAHYADRLTSARLSAEEIKELNDFYRTEAHKDIRVPGSENFLDPPPYYFKEAVEGATLFSCGFKMAGLKKVWGAYQATPYPLVREILISMLKEVDLK